MTTANDEKISKVRENLNDNLKLLNAVLLDSVKAYDKEYTDEFLSKLEDVRKLTWDSIMIIKR
jgi:hypothetical protein